MSEVLVFEVPPEHIRSGIKCCSTMCPVALTLRMRYPEAVCVDVDVDAVVIDGEIWVDDGETLSKFIDAYDCDEWDVDTFGYPYPIRLRRGE